MIVKFDSVRCSSEESYQREKDVEKGYSDVPFFREADYIGSMYINLDEVKDWSGGRTYFNDMKLDCCYVSLRDDLITDNILMTAEEFSLVYQYYKKFKRRRFRKNQVVDAKHLLTEIHVKTNGKYIKSDNENNSKSPQVKKEGLLRKTSFFSKLFNSSKSDR